MKDDSQQTTSGWMATAETPSEPNLEEWTRERFPQMGDVDFDGPER
jgi:hypothetical protein